MRLEDAQQLVSNRLHNRGTLSSFPEQFEQAYYAVDIVNEALKAGMKPSDRTHNNRSGMIEASEAEAYLRSKGKLEEAQARSGIYNKAKTYGKETDSLEEALSFVESYQTARDQAQRAGISIPENATFDQLQSAIQSKSSAFNTEAARTQRTQSTVNPQSGTGGFSDFTSTLFGNSSSSRSSRSTSTPSVDPSVPKGLVKFETPSGAVFGFNDGKTIRAATGQEAVNAATGKASFKTVSASTTTPFQEFTRTSSGGGDQFLDSDIYSSLPADQQEAVRAVYDAIANNDAEQADRLKSAFEVAEKIADPFFAEQIRLARDELERGFVSIDNEKEFQEQQLTKRLQDLKQDIETRKEFLSLEEQSQLRGIEREYTQQLKNVRQDLAASGFTSSTRRAETEGLLEETTGDLRESTTRRFGAQVEELATQGTRAQRDFQSEVDRLAEVTQGNKLALLRDAESRLGTKNLPALSGNLSPLGNVVGSIEQNRQADIISGARNLIF